MVGGAGANEQRGRDLGALVPYDPSTASCLWPALLKEPGAAEDHTIFTAGAGAGAGACSTALLLSLPTALDETRLRFPPARHSPNLSSPTPNFNRDCPGV